MSSPTTRQVGRAGAVVIALTCVCTAATSAGENTLHEPQPVDLVRAILRADYQGDRAALQTLRGQMPTASSTRPAEARLRYWRGFALWRRAINGMNQAADRHELQADLRSAVGEFELADSLDRGFVDARIALISCYQLLAFVTRAEPAESARWVEKFVPLLREVSASARENPRLLWVQGQSEWYTPPGAPPDQVRARQATALATYKRGLEAARRAKAAGGLEPAWGEPELLMNLAWAYNNGIDRDAAAARRFAEEALALVPDWSYVRDVLLPQIAEADTIDAKAPTFTGRFGNRVALR